MVTGLLHVEGWDVPLQEPEVLGVSLLTGCCRLSWKHCLGSVLGCLMVAVCAFGIEIF